MEAQDDPGAGRGSLRLLSSTSLGALLGLWAVLFAAAYAALVQLLGPLIALLYLVALTGTAVLLLFVRRRRAHRAPVPGATIESLQTRQV